MPNNQDGVINKSFSDLLISNIQFEVPFFQRGYAWNKRNWNQLYEDIQENIEEEIKKNIKPNEIEYFFGPFVVLEKTTNRLGLQHFQIIDGQQRITTIYILLASIKKCLSAQKNASQNTDEYAFEIEKYLINNVNSGDDYDKLKVLSTKGDRYPTYKTIFGEQDNPKSTSIKKDLNLYNPDTNNIRSLQKWADEKIKNKSVTELWQLAQILLYSMKVVWIPLNKEKDDPQAIFESLNDKGTPLTSTELICNYTFKPLIDNNYDFENLHDVWLESVRIIGHAEFENYLRYWLSIGETETIGTGQRAVYVFFKRKYKYRDTISKKFKEFLEEIKKYSHLYKTLLEPNSNNEINQEIKDIIGNINKTGLKASYPFLLDVLIKHYLKEIDNEKVIVMFNEVLILLVRRKICGLGTQSYNKIFPKLLGSIISEPNIPKAIQDYIKKNDYYVPDQNFQEALINEKLYNTRETIFVSMILKEIDKKMFTYGQTPDYTALKTIEHVLPQKLENTNWKIYLGDDFNNEDLERYKHSLGNLCLLSQPANSAVGNNPFEDKKNDTAYKENPTKLIKDIIDWQEKWNIEAIKLRSEKLSKIALEVWKWTE